MKTTLGDLFGEQLRALARPAPVAAAPVQIYPPGAPALRPEPFDEAQLVGEVLEWLQRTGRLASTTDLQGQFFAYRDAL
jgi:hypothetical protein